MKLRLFIRILLSIIIVYNSQDCIAKGYSPEKTILDAAISEVSKMANGKIKKKKLKNGEYYIGEWSKGKPNGYGQKIFANKSTYTGDFENGLFEGYGRMCYSDGSMYEGEWKNGLREGIGKYTSRGSSYDGLWESNYMVGGDANIKITFTNKDSIVYKGIVEFKDSSTLYSFIPIKGDLYIKGTNSEILMKGNWEKNNIFIGEVNYSKGRTIFDYYGSCKTKDFGVMDHLIKGKKSTKKSYDQMIIKEIEEGEFIRFVLFNGTRELSSYLFNINVAIKDGQITDEARINWTSNEEYIGGINEDYKYNGEGTLYKNDDQIKGQWKDGTLQKGKARLTLDKRTILLDITGSKIKVTDPTGYYSGVYEYSVTGIDDLSRDIKTGKKKQLEELAKQREMQFWERYNKNLVGLSYYADVASFSGRTEDHLARVLFQSGTGVFLTLYPNGKILISHPKSNGIGDMFQELFKSFTTNGIDIVDMIYNGSEDVFALKEDRGNFTFTDNFRNIKYIRPDGSSINFSLVTPITPQITNKVPDFISPGRYKGQIVILDLEKNKPLEAPVEGYMECILYPNNEYVFTIEVNIVGPMSFITSLFGAPEDNRNVRSGYYKIRNGKVELYNEEGKSDGALQIILNSNGLFFSGGIYYSILTR